MPPSAPLHVPVGSRRGGTAPPAGDQAARPSSASNSIASSTSSRGCVKSAAICSGESPAARRAESWAVGMRVPARHGAPNCTAGSSRTCSRMSHQTARPPSYATPRSVSPSVRSRTSWPRRFAAVSRSAILGLALYRTLIPSVKISWVPKHLRRRRGKAPAANVPAQLGQRIESRAHPSARGVARFGNENGSPLRHARRPSPSPPTTSKPTSPTLSPRCPVRTTCPTRHPPLTGLETSSAVASTGNSVSVRVRILDDTHEHPLDTLL